MLQEDVTASSNYQHSNSQPATDVATPSQLITRDVSHWFCLPFPGLINCPRTAVRTLDQASKPDQNNWDELMGQEDRNTAVYM